MSVAARRRTLAALALVALAIVAVLLIGRGGDDSSPAKDRAVQLVPANALVYAHVSTSRDNEDARRLAARFPSFGRLRDGILRRLSVSGRGGNVDEWLGDDAALALLPAQGTTAGSLVVVGVRDEKAARDFVASGRGSGSTQGTYHGVKLNQYGQVLAAFVDGFLVLGQKASVQQAIDLAQGRGRGLADGANYRRAIKGLPEDRVIDAYATGDGVRRLLTPAGGLLGIAGVLLDRPGLRATALALEVKEPGAVLTSHTLGDPGDFGPFRPQLLATRLTPSVVPRTKITSRGSLAPIQAAARTRTSS